MVLNGAQFVGVATIAVYAGAIVVTFLFVLMLAQPEGHSFYDRVSWGATPAGVGIVAGMLFAASTTWAVRDFAPSDALVAAGPPRQVLGAEHVAALGGQLFGPQLVLVEVAGVLLLAALVGAVAMASQGAHQRAQVPHGGTGWERGSDHE
jgi:NADH-quinone oxidoreductase subunit J